MTIERSLLGSALNLVLLISFSIGSAGKVVAQDPKGFSEYWGAHPSDDIIMYKDGVYMHPCIGRHCEIGNINWIYGGTAYVVNKGVLRTEHGVYYCHPGLLTRKNISQQCTKNGFAP
jgi:hypothetical protein